MESRTLIDQLTQAGYVFATAAETAKIIRCDRRTVLRGIMAGDIPATRITPTGEWRVPLSWLRQRALLKAAA